VKCCDWENGGDQSDDAGIHERLLTGELFLQIKKSTFTVTLRLCLREGQEKGERRKEEPSHVVRK
jgi:hypothetical protein